MDLPPLLTAQSLRFLPTHTQVSNNNPNASSATAAWATQPLCTSAVAMYGAEEGGA